MRPDDEPLVGRQETPQQRVGETPAPVPRAGLSATSTCARQSPISSCALSPDRASGL
jgi:hypothetical protein